MLSFVVQLVISHGMNQTNSRLGHQKGRLACCSCTIHVINANARGGFHVLCLVLEEREPEQSNCCAAAAITQCTSGLCRDRESYMCANVSLTLFLSIAVFLVSDRQRHLPQQRRKEGARP